MQRGLQTRLAFWDGESLDSSGEETALVDVGGEEIETVIGEMVAVLENGMVTFARGRILSRLAEVVTSHRRDKRVLCGPCHCSGGSDQKKAGGGIQL